jgi:hypothetical protein
VRFESLDRRAEGCAFLIKGLEYEQRTEKSAELLPSKVPGYIPRRYEDFTCGETIGNAPQKQSNEPKWQRRSEPKGPLAVFGYDYFAEHAKVARIATPKLLSYEGLWGAGEEYAYEVLNFADGKRNAQEIRDAVSAEYGPVPVEMVVEYLRALEKIGVVSEVK